LGYKMTTIFEI